MEQVLNVYKRPYDARFPVVCMDESPRQLIDEVKMPVPDKPDQLERHDYEYKRCGHATFSWQMNHWPKYEWLR
jgi:hypothetical protein